MLLVFIFSVVVQYNDPDPLLWMSVYGAAAVASIFEVMRRTRWWFPAGIGAATLAWAATIAPRVLGRVRFGDLFAEFEMKNIAVEEAREMGGLLIIAAWVLVLAFASWKRSRR
jgi:hypothetical protein